MQSTFKICFIKIAPKVGPGASHECEFLHRKIGWSQEGFYWEHDRKYVVEMAEALQLTGKTVSTPGLQEHCRHTDAFGARPRGHSACDEGGVAWDEQS
eukprot:1012563-Amphidinium_carterae.2